MRWMNGANETGKVSPLVFSSLLLSSHPSPLSCKSIFIYVSILVYASIYVSIYVCICPSIYVSLSLYVSIHHFICLSVFYNFLYKYRPMYRYVSLCACVCLSICIFLFSTLSDPTLLLILFLSIYPSIYFFLLLTVPLIP